jgi:hypothetical protein
VPSRVERPRLPDAVAHDGLTGKPWRAAREQPAGVFSIIGLVVVCSVIGRGGEARWLIAAGLLIMAAGNYWMALVNLYISPGQWSGRGWC